MFFVSDLAGSHVIVVAELIGCGLEAVWDRKSLPTEKKLALVTSSERLVVVSRERVGVCGEACSYHIGSKHWWTRGECTWIEEGR